MQTLNFRKVRAHGKPREGSQLATVEIHSHGLVVVVEDQSKTLQGKAFFRTELFKTYEFHCHSRQRFAVDLAKFIDCLLLMKETAREDGIVELRYPGPANVLVMAVTDEVENTCTDAGIRTSDAQRFVQFKLDDAIHPVSTFNVATTVLKV